MGSLLAQSATHAAGHQPSLTKGGFPEPYLSTLTLALAAA
jgi:hypothetical protein